MHAPPDPETNRGAAANGTPNSKPLISKNDIKPDASGFQARKLRALFSFCRSLPAPRQTGGAA